jgi:uncharacterized membrane protein YeaQ/YmgE (transglycosylase-associated protein family)
MFAPGTLLDHTVLAAIVITASEIVYLIVAAIVGIIAESLVGWRLPLGLIGAMIAAILGIWLLTNVIQVTIPNDPVIQGVPVLKALLGAVILVALWHLLTFRAWRPRRRYDRRVCFSQTRGSRWPRFMRFSRPRVYAPRAAAPR